MDFYEKMKELCKWLNENRAEAQNQNVSILISAVKRDEDRITSCACGDGFDIVEMCQRAEKKAIRNLQSKMYALIEYIAESEDDEEGGEEWLS